MTTMAMTKKMVQNRLVVVAEMGSLGGNTMHWYFVASHLKKKARVPWSLPFFLLLPREMMIMTKVMRMRRKKRQ